MAKEKVLPGVHPNAGLEMEFRRRLLKIIRQMNVETVETLSVAFRAHEPALLASDADPADALRRAMADLSKQWTARFDEAAEELGAYFAQAASARTDAALKAILRKSGFSVKFKVTAAQRDVLKATVQANVQLIRSIPEQFLGQVEQSVMRSVQTGRDLGALTKDLETHFGVTRRRAALIARSQNNMATAALSKARFQELGITHARWVHSQGGKSKRASHVKASADKVVYEISSGWYDPDEGKSIQPGELPNCRCVARPIIKAIA